MIVTQAVPDLKAAILELRKVGKTDQEIYSSLLDADNIDLMFSEWEIETDSEFNIADHMETIDEAFRQLKVTARSTRKRGGGGAVIVGVLGALGLTGLAVGRGRRRRRDRAESG